MALVLFQSAQLARSPRIAHESLINFAREPDRVPKACIVGARACRQSSGGDVRLAPSQLGHYVGPSEREQGCIAALTDKAVRRERRSHSERMP